MLPRTALWIIMVIGHVPQACTGAWIQGKMWNIIAPMSPIYLSLTGTPYFAFSKVGLHTWVYIMKSQRWSLYPLIKPPRLPLAAIRRK